MPPPIPWPALPPLAATPPVAPVVTRRTLLWEHHPDDRLALVAGAAQRLEADQRRRAAPVAVADVQGKVHAVAHTASDRQERPQKG
jgi:hypothetical protein